MSEEEKKDFIVLYEEDTKRIIACIDLNGGESIFKNGVEAKEYHGTEPVFEEVSVNGVFDGVCLAEDSFIVTLQGDI